MDPLALAFFPFPHVRSGSRHEGSLYRWLARCSSCDHQCERAADGEIRLCSYGVNYTRFDHHLIVAGIVIRDYPQMTPARRKALNAQPQGPTLSLVNDVRSRYGALEAVEADEIQARKDESIAAYLNPGGHREELLELLKPKLEQLVLQIHDYRQFVARVVQNMNVILETRVPHAPIEDKLAAAAHEEVAIYWAARLMEEKLHTWLFFLEPERLDDTRQDVAFRLHGCVLKYLRIYQRSFEEKGIQIDVSGKSYGELVANPQAIGVIPHTLLDNALKYAPRSSVVKIRFVESETVICFTVGCYGPRLLKGEEKKIFELFYRGVEAQRMEAEGSGFGLYLAQVIATKNDGAIRVAQQPRDRKGDRLWTEFTVTFQARSRAG